MKPLSRTEKWLLVLIVLFSALLVWQYVHMTKSMGTADYRIITERGAATLREYSGEESGEESGGEEKTDGVDINSADLDALMTLEGIGPELAQRIVAYREENGGFSAPSELMKVEGIGEKIYEKNADKIICVR